MRTFRTFLFILAVMFSAYFLFGYTRAVHTLYEPPDGIGLLGVPHVCAWRPLPHFETHSGMSLFLASDAPEGTIPIFRFPSWPLALGAGAILIYAVFTLFVRRKSRVV